MEDLLLFLKAGYSIIVLDDGKCAIGKFSDEEDYFDKEIGIIDGCLTDLIVVDSIESLIEFVKNHSQTATNEKPYTQN